jgi:branched-subunit amino acid transport protein AzlD
MTYVAFMTRNLDFCKRVVLFDFCFCDNNSATRVLCTGKKNLIKAHIVKTHDYVSLWFVLNFPTPRRKRGSRERIKHDILVSIDFGTSVFLVIFHTD